MIYFTNNIIYICNFVILVFINVSNDRNVKVSLAINPNPKRMRDFMYARFLYGQSEVNITVKGVKEAYPFFLSPKAWLASSFKYHGNL